MISSGGIVGRPEYAGVGFLLVLWARQLVIGFTGFSNRIASLKLRGKGEQFVISCAYVVQGGREFIKRYSFYDSLSDYYS